MWWIYSDNNLQFSGSELWALPKLIVRMNILNFWRSAKLQAQALSPSESSGWRIIQRNFPDLLQTGKHVTYVTLLSSPYPSFPSNWWPSERYASSTNSPKSTLIRLLQYKYTTAQRKKSQKRLNLNVTSHILLQEKNGRKTHDRW